MVLGVQVHGAVLAGKLDGVGQQVGQSLAETLAVDQHQHLGHVTQSQLHPVLVGEHRHVVPGLRQQRRQPPGAALEGHLAGRQLFDVQQIIDQERQLLAVAVGQVGQFPGFVRQGPALSFTIRPRAAEMEVRGVLSSWLTVEMN